VTGPVIEGIGEFSLVQEDGALPTVLAAGSAPGESRVSILSMRFQGGVHFSALPRQHLIWFRLSDVRIECCRAGRRVRQDVPAGSVAICPAEIDCGADAEESVDALLVCVAPGKLSLAAAEDSVLNVRLHERLDLARTLALESEQNYPNGTIFWNVAAEDFIARLVARHTSEPDRRARGVLSKDVFKRIKDYVVAHLDEAIDVAALASIAGRSPFHFSRVFARSIGVTPHHYVVYVQLLRAFELVREGRRGLVKSRLAPVSPIKVTLALGSARLRRLAHGDRQMTQAKQQKSS
jgi:AraC family transcriptional regulator